MSWPRPARRVPSRIETVVCDVAERSAVSDLIAGRPEVIFDLAAVVSGEAELDFDKGYRVNLDATRHLLEAVRTSGGLPAASCLQLVGRGVRPAASRGDR